MASGDFYLLRKMEETKNALYVGESFSDALNESLKKFTGLSKDYEFQPLFSMPAIVTKKWGREIIIVNNNKYCGKILHYDLANTESSGHFHKRKHETFYCVAGSFIFSFWDEKGIKKSRTLRVGETVTIPPCTPHQLFPLEDNSEIFEISTPHSDSDVIRIEPGASQR